MSLGLLSLDGVLSITSFEQFQRHTRPQAAMLQPYHATCTAMPGHPQNHYCARGLEFAPRIQASRTGQQEAQLARTETNDTLGSA